MTKLKKKSTGLKTNNFEKIQAKLDILKNSNTEMLEKSNFEKKIKKYNCKKNIIKTQKLEFELNSTESLTKL